MALFFKSLLVFILCLFGVPPPIQGQIIVEPLPCLRNYHLDIIILSTATSPILITPGEAVVGFVSSKTTTITSKPYYQSDYATSIPDENIEVGTSLRAQLISITDPVEEESFVPYCGGEGTCTPTGIIGVFRLQIPTDACGLYGFRIQFRHSISKTDLGCGVVPLLVIKKFH